MLKTNWCCLTFVACLQTAIHAQNIDLGTLKGQINERVKAKPLEINGGISFNTVTTLGMQPNPQPFTYVASGNLIFKIKNYDLPFSFMYTNRKWNYQNPTFKFSQRKNRCVFELFQFSMNVLILKKIKKFLIFAA